MAFIANHEPELEAKLGKLGDEFIDKGNRKNPFFILISAAFILGAILLIVIFTRLLPPKSNNISTEPTEQNLDSLILLEPVDSVNSIETTTPPSDNTIKNKKKNSTSSQPIASLDVEAFAQNPLMESIIQNQYRNELTTSATTVVKPKADEIFNGKKGIEFRVEGFTTLPPPYQLYIYSNDNFEIENDYFMLSAPLNTKSEGDKYTFYYYADVPFGQGLYYFTIKNKDTGELMHITRFKVQ